ESGISLLHWRRLCHGGRPVARNGPKDTDVTPVFPRYYSPGLPTFATPPPFLWSVKTPSIQVACSVVHGSGALARRGGRHRRRFLALRERWVQRSPDTCVLFRLFLCHERAS